MAFEVLDLATLFVMTATVVGFSGLVLVLMLGRDRNQSSRAPLIWGVAMIVGAIGIICLSLEPLFGRISEASGNALILFGTALSWTAARVFDRRPSVPHLVVVGPVASLLWTVIPVQADSRVSLILTLIVGSTYTIATAAELWHGRDEKLPSRTIAVVLLLIHSGVYLGRAFSEGFRPSAGWRYENDIAASLIIEALLHTIAMAFLLMGLTKERAESRSTIRL